MPWGSSLAARYRAYIVRISYLADDGQAESTPKVRFADNAGIGLLIKTSAFGSNDQRFSREGADVAPVTS